MCLETAWRVMSNSSAKALGVRACVAINTKMALRVGSAMAWKISRFICISIIWQPISCKYKRNPSVSQVFGQFFLGPRGLLGGMGVCMGFQPGSLGAEGTLSRQGLP